MNKRPMRGGFYTVDQGMRDLISQYAQAAENRRVSNAKGKAYRSGEMLSDEREQELRNNPGMLQAALEYLQQDTGQAMAARGAIVGSGLTASGAGLVQLMQFLTQGTQAQAERNDVLSS